MSTQMIICLVIFVATLVSYVLNKIPMWVTALLSLSALYVTKCIDANEALAGFANNNTILMAACFILAMGFNKTSVVDKLCNFLLKVFKGSTWAVYVGYMILAAILTNLISSPMVCYAIVSPLLCSLLDKQGESRSKYMFALVVVCVGCCGILPFATAVSQAAQFTGFMETYGFTGGFDTMAFFYGRWPVMVVILLWAAFLAPKTSPQTPVLPIAAAEKKAKDTSTKLSRFTDTAGIIIFFASVVLMVKPLFGMPSWFYAFFFALLMVVFKVVDQRAALSEIPWDMLMLYVGALALGTGLVNTGAGEMMGNWLAGVVGGTKNSYVIGALFFVIPFVITQFMLNRSVTAVFIPICLLTCSALGANPIGPMMLVQAGSLTAFMTPMATPAVPMAMADGGYDLNSLFKSGWMISVFLCIVYIFYTMTVYPCF